MTIRPFRPSDAAAVHAICLATANNGLPNPLVADPNLIGYVFADPYVVLEPELAFVLDEGGEAIGYVVGALDTAEFFARWRREWAPRFAETHPAPAGERADWTKDETLRAVLHDPKPNMSGGAPGYPSHLHINLLAQARGNGTGRAMMTTFMDALRAKGSTGVHLGVNKNNTGAQAFYRSLGFTELPGAVPGAVLFGHRL